MIKFKKISEEEVKKIDNLQSEFFSKFMHIFEAPLPEGVSEHLQKIVESAKVSSTDTVMDIGTGTGILIPLIKKHKPHLIYAIDLSETMLESVKKHFPRVRTIRRDVRDLKLPNKSIDIFFINACYPNIADKHKSFTNISRMLKKGGRVVISHPMGSSFVNFLKKEMPFPLDDFPEKKSEAQTLFESYGLNVKNFINEKKLYILVLKSKQ